MASGAPTAAMTTSKPPPSTVPADALDPAVFHAAHQVVADDPRGSLDALGERVDAEDRGPYGPGMRGVEHADRAEPQHEDGLARPDRDLVLAVDDGVERLDERAALDRCGRVQRDDPACPDPVGRDRDLLGHGARQVVAEDPAVRAQVAVARPARPTGLARRSRADRDLGAGGQLRHVRGHDGAGELVAGDLRPGQARTAVPPGPDVGAADADGAGPHDQSARRKRRLGDVVETQVARPVEDDGPHRAVPAIVRPVARVPRASCRNAAYRSS